MRNALRLPSWAFGGSVLIMKRAGLLGLLLGCGTSGSQVAAIADGGTEAGNVVLPEIDAGPLRDTCRGNAYRGAWLADPRLCLSTFATSLGRPRQFAFAPNEDLFVSRGGAIVVLYDANQDGASDDNERSTFAAQTGLNHGLVFSPDARWLYASSATTVYRWAYARGDRQASGAAQIVVKGIPGGGHDTRTLVFDGAGRLYVNIGSAGNVDDSAALWQTRAMVRRWDVSNVPNGGFDYAQGEVFASGLRNEVGLHIDVAGRFWGVENGRDNLNDPSFGDITNDNPGEELHRFDVNTPGKFFGYPFCWTEGQLNGGSGRGTQWADETISPQNRKTDAFCRDDASVVKPAFAMQAHWAPLGITLYNGRALPWRGDLFIAAHGSWNRSPATGRVIARAHVNADSTIASVEAIVGQDVGGALTEGAWDVRPVDIRQGPDEALYFSDDSTGSIFRLGYR